MSLATDKALYRAANMVYNNDPNGKLILTDDEFDALEHKIRKADPTWEHLRATGAKVNKKVEVRLPHYSQEPLNFSLVRSLNPCYRP